MAAAVYDLSHSLLPFPSAVPRGYREIIAYQTSIPTTTVDEVGDIILLAEVANPFVPTRILLNVGDLDTNGSPAHVWTLGISNVRSNNNVITGSTFYDVITGITTGQAGGTYDTDALAVTVKANLMKLVPDVTTRLHWALRTTTAAATAQQFSLFAKITGHVGPPFAYSPALSAYTGTML